MTTREIEVKEAQVTWVEGMQFVGEAHSGHAIVMDSDERVGGRNTGLRPMELVLVGLAGCTAMDVISILRKKRQEVTGFQVKVKGTRAPEHPRVYTAVDIEYLVRGHNLAEAAVREAIELSQAKYCSVSAMIGKTATIRYTYHLEDEGTGARSPVPTQTAS
jgi:putative redox protein